MKLFTKYNRINMITGLIILVASSLTYYLIMHHIFIAQLDRDLQVEEEEIYDYVRVNNRLPNASVYKGQEIKFTPSAAGKIKRVLKTITIHDPVENEEEFFRMLTFPVTVNGEIYKATVLKSQVETEDLLQLILSVTAGMFFFMLIISIVLNRFLLNKLWQPFYFTLKQLRSFNLGNDQPVLLPATNLSEFSELNNSVTEMTRRVTNEFASLKSFTENASHEMQTPLAIINTKLDLLLQTSTEEQSEPVQAIYDATNRLSRLNQTLLLLTKIENEQFKGKENVDLKELLDRKFRQFEELMSSANIKLTCNAEHVHVSLNRELADILLNNLISNAIKHNVTGGSIDCQLKKGSLTLTNTGKQLSFPPADIFKRFQKSDHSDGSGLGLAVVKQIADRYHLRLGYENVGNKHSFIISF